MGAESFADTERTENFPQQIVRAEFAGDLSERLLTQTQFLCHQLAGAALVEMPQRLFEMFVRAIEGIEVATAGEEHSRICAVVADAFLQMFAQQIHAFAGRGGDVHARR